MTNPFSGIISSDFKQLFNNAISSLLYNDALTLPCTLHYGVTKYNDCGNCVFDPIGNKSSNNFKAVVLFLSHLAVYVQCVEVMVKHQLKPRKILI